jgi:PadR family transcriptional regulator, regulatory protein PadR
MASSRRNAREPRITAVTQQVLLVFLESPTPELYGWQVCKRTGYPSGTIYPLLIRMERRGWVQSRWEPIDPYVEHRPRRRYYVLTTEGMKVARACALAPGDLPV